MAGEEGVGGRRVRLEGERIAARPILLVGASGLVGRHVRAALRGRRVVATYRRTPAPDAVPLDITDRGAIDTLVASIDPATIILAAAEASVEGCEREPQRTRVVNVTAAEAFARAAMERDATLVVFSSEYVFDGADGPYGESDEVSPINEYGRQKVQVEAIARRAGRHLICRTSAVFGREPDGKNFVSQLVRALRAAQEFRVPSDQVVTPTYAPELGRAIAALLEMRATGTFHVVGPRVLPRVEFAHLAAAAFGLPAELIRRVPTFELGLIAPRPLSAGLADRKLRATLGGPLLDPGAALALMRPGEGSAVT